MKRKLVLLAFLLALFAQAGLASANTPLRLVTEQGRSLLELRPGRGEQSGALLLHNDGAAPVSRVRLSLEVEDESRPERAPGALDVAFEDGRTERELAPGAAVRVFVRWSLGSDNRVREVYARVYARSGSEVAAAGVHGELTRTPAFLADHPLSVLLVLPLVGCVALLALAVARWPRLGSVPSGVAGIAALQLALVAMMLARFDERLGRFDGNDGFQFIERSVLSRAWGVEYSLGVDGISAPILLLIPLSVLCCAAFARPRVERALPFWLSILLFDAAACAALAALDACLLGAAWLAELGAFGWMLSLAARDFSVRRFGVLWLSSAALAGLALHELSEANGPAFLSDGTRAMRTFSIPDWISRLSGGASDVRSGFWLSFLAFSGAALVWSASVLRTTLRGADLSARVLWSAGLLSVAAYGTLRLCGGVLSAELVRSSQWLSFGGLLIAAVSVLALGRGRDVQTFVLTGALLPIGGWLLGLGSCTPSGIEGGIALLFGQGLTSTTLGACLGFFERTVPVTDRTKSFGLGRAQPLLVLLSLPAACVAAALPGTLGFIGWFLTLHGAFPRERLAVGVEAFACFSAGAYHMRTWVGLFAGRCDPRLLRHERLEPYGGRFPRLAFKEVVVLSLLALLACGASAAPGLLFRITDRSIYELSEALNRLGPARIAVRDAAVPLACRRK